MFLKKRIIIWMILKKNIGASQKAQNYLGSSQKCANIGALQKRIHGSFVSFHVRSFRKLAYLNH